MHTHQTYARKCHSYKEVQGLLSDFHVICFCALTLSLPNFWGNVLLIAKYILGNVTTEGLAV